MPGRKHPAFQFTTCFEFDTEHTMSSSPSLILNSIEVDYSSGSERLLTPPSPTLTSSTYSRQYNVTPTPEPRIAGLQEDLDELHLSQHHAPEAEEGDP